MAHIGYMYVRRKVSFWAILMATLGRTVSLTNIWKSKNLIMHKERATLKTFLKSMALRTFFRAVLRYEVIKIAKANISISLSDQKYFKL